MKLGEGASSTSESRVVVRTDASLAIGTGHVMRCLTLASALRKHGAAVSFICREHDGHLCHLIEKCGFSVSRLPAPRAVPHDRYDFAQTVHLASSWQEDVEQTRAAIGDSGAEPDWLVVDHYNVDQRWESALRTSVDRIMVLDDLADRMHDCDLLLDQNLVGQRSTRYVGRVPATCAVLLGVRYALLQPIYAELHNRVPARGGPVRRMLVFMGGADQENLTGRTLAAFLSLDRPDIDIDVVFPSGSPCAQAIREQAVGHANVNLHCDLPTLAPLMAKADLAVGAAGATSWERLCLGLPAVVVTLADHQRPIADEQQQQGLIRWLGHHDQVTKSTIRQALKELIQQGLDVEWSNRCRATVDGLGVQRVCEALTGGSDRVEGSPRQVVNRSPRARKRLLFTGGGGASSEALHRLLRGRYDVHFADADPEAKPYSVPLTSWHPISLASSPVFVEELGRLCRELDVDLLIPSVDEELLPISQARDAMACEVLLPPTEFIRTHLDKLTSHSLLRALGLPSPETESLRERQCVNFPCIVKPRQGRGSRDVAIVHSEQELRAHIVLCRRQPDDFIVQELLQGQEYTVMMAADQTSHLRAVVPVKVRLKRGITLRAETDRDEKVIAACVAIHAAHPVTGCFNVQLVKTKEGDVKPFEINPRISTTTCLALAAGVDFIDMYLGSGQATNLTMSGLASFQDNLQLKRSWHHEFLG